MDKICFFIKYYDEEPKMEEINNIDSIILLKFLDIKRIDKAYNYIKQKNEIFKKPFEFTLKEKLFISLNIYCNIYKDIDEAKLIKLYSLPKESPYVQSELKYRDLIMNLTYDSCLYFFYLQLISNCDVDIISSRIWYKIKKISLNEIQSHLLSHFSPYFFSFYSKHPAAFTNPQTLLKTYNESRDIGYLSLNNFAETISLENTIKLFFIKIFEGSQYEYKHGFNTNNSGRYLLNYDLKVIDCQSDNRKECYIAEIYIFGGNKIFDELLSSSESLESLSNMGLYTDPNFDILRNELTTKILGRNSKDIKNENNDSNEEIGLMDIFLKSLDDGIY